MEKEGVRAGRRRPAGSLLTQQTGGCPKSRNVTPGTNQGGQCPGPWSERAAACWGDQDTHLKVDAPCGCSGCAGTGARKVGKSRSCWRGSSDGDTDDMDCHQCFPGTPWARPALCWGCSSSPGQSCPSKLGAVDVPAPLFPSSFPFPG